MPHFTFILSKFAGFELDFTVIGLLNLSLLHLHMKFNYDQVFKFDNN